MKSARLHKLFRTLVLLGAGVFALSSSAPALASLSQGFAAKAPIATGSLVSLDEKSSGTVVATDLNNVSRLFGVVVAPSSTSISLSNGSGQVQVATSGTVPALVSTAGGDIRVGDYITVSPITGVGQKATGTSVRVIGTSQADFTASSVGATKTSIDVDGQKKEVAVGQLPVSIAVSSYTATDGKQSYVIPNWLQNLSNTAAGKAVSPVRIIMAALILVIVVISCSVLLYSAVRNSIISIGRNPLARSGVIRSMLIVALIALLMLAVAAVAIYLVITK